MLDQHGEISGCPCLFAICFFRVNHKASRCWLPHHLTHRYCHLEKWRCDWRSQKCCQIRMKSDKKIAQKKPTHQSFPCHCSSWVSAPRLVFEAVDVVTFRVALCSQAFLASPRQVTAIPASVGLDKCAAGLIGQICRKRIRESPISTAAHFFFRRFPCVVSYLSMFCSSSCVQSPQQKARSSPRDQRPWRTALAFAHVGAADIVLKI